MALPLPSSLPSLVDPLKVAGWLPKQPQGKAQTKADAGQGDGIRAGAEKLAGPRRRSAEKAVFVVGRLVINNEK